MNISVIIPTLNEEKRIGRLLSSLEQQSMQPHEVFVIDATSEDATPEIVKTYPRVKLHQMGKGVGHQRQKGGELATGELLVFLDADTQLEKDFLLKVQKQFNSEEFQVACPRYIPDSGQKHMRYIYGFFNKLFWVFQKLSPSGAGSCVVTTKKAFTESGGFDGTLQFDDIAYIRKVGRTYGFKQLPIDILVSDRRFEEYGVLRMLGVYGILSILFFFGQFRLSNYVNYTFGKYKK